MDLGKHKMGAGRICHGASQSIRRKPDKTFGDVEADVLALECPATRRGNSYDVTPELRLAELAQGGRFEASVATAIEFGPSVRRQPIAGAVAGRPAA